MCMHANYIHTLHTQMFASDAGMASGAAVRSHSHLAAEAVLAVAVLAVAVARVAVPRGLPSLHGGLLL